MVNFYLLPGLSSEAGAFLVPIFEARAARFGYMYGDCVGGKFD